MTDHKTDWLARLLGTQRTQKKGGCCSYTIEELPEEGSEDLANQSGAPAVERPSCCGAAFGPARGDAKSK